MAAKLQFLVEFGSMAVVEPLVSDAHDDATHSIGTIDRTRLQQPAVLGQTLRATDPRYGASARTGSRELERLYRRVDADDVASRLSERNGQDSGATSKVHHPSCPDITYEPAEEVVVWAAGVSTSYRRISRGSLYGIRTS